MTTNQKAQLLKSLQKLDHEMRTRHYPAVLESDEEPTEFDDPRDYETFGEEEQGYHGDRR